MAMHVVVKVDWIYLGCYIHDVTLVWVKTWFKHILLLKHTYGNSSLTPLSTIFQLYRGSQFY
jgi:hypothetical protein